MDLREEQKLASAAIGQQPLEKLEKLRRAVHTVGGRFPKALLAIDSATGLFYEDDPRLDPRFERWIVKFGIPAAERDNLLNYPEIEYAYSRMAGELGIRMPRTAAAHHRGQGRETGPFRDRAFRRGRWNEASRRHSFGAD